PEPAPRPGRAAAAVPAAAAGSVRPAAVRPAAAAAVRSAAAGRTRGRALGGRSVAADRHAAPAGRAQRRRVRRGQGEDTRRRLSPAYSSRVAVSSIVVPVSALLTGQFFLASSAAAANSAAVRPGTTACTVRGIAVMPSGSPNVTSALVVMLVGGCPASDSPCDSAIEKQPEWAAAMSSSGLVRPLGASARDSQVSSKVPSPDESRLTDPLPVASGPSQRVVAVRTVATMTSPFTAGTGRTGCQPRTDPVRPPP